MFSSIRKGCEYFLNLSRFRKASVIHDIRHDINKLSIIICFCPLSSGKLHDLFKQMLDPQSSQQVMGIGIWKHSVCRKEGSCMLLPSHEGSFICILPESHFNSPMKLSKNVRTVSVENDLMI